METAGELRKVSAWLAAQPSEALTVPLRVQSASSELRIEFSLEAPWLPLDLVLLREGQEDTPCVAVSHGFTWPLEGSEMQTPLFLHGFAGETMGTGPACGATAHHAAAKHPSGLDRSLT